MSLHSSNSGSVEIGMEAASVGKWFPTGRDAAFKSQIIFFALVQGLLRIRMLILLPFLARILGAAEYGTWAALTAFSGAVVTVAAMGTPTALRVLIPGLGKEDRAREFWAVLNFTMTGAVLLGVVLFVFRDVFSVILPRDGVSSSLYAIVLAMILLTVALMLLESQIVSNHQGKSLSRITVWISLLNLISVAVGAAVAGLIGVFFALLATVLAQVILLIPVVGRIDPFRFGFGQLSVLRKYYAYGFNVFLAGALFWIVDLADRILLSRVVASQELGIYHVVCSMCSETALLGAPIFIALLPQLRKAIETGDTALFRQHMNNSLRVLCLLYGFGLVFLWANGRDILFVLTSESFVSGAKYFPFVAFAMLFSQLAALVVYGLHAHKLFSRSLLPLAAAAVLSACLNLALIPRFGVMAAAFSRMISFGLYLAAVLYVSRELGLFKFSFVSVLKNVLVLAVCGMGLALAVLLPINPYLRLPISVLIGIGCLIVLSWKLKLIHRDELQMMRTALHRLSRARRGAVL